MGAGAGSLETGSREGHDSPLPRDHRVPIAFDRIRVSHVEEASRRVIDDLERMRAALLQAQPRRRISLLDAVYDHLDKLLSPVYLLGEVHDRPELRDACQSAGEHLFSLQDELNRDRGIYTALQETAELKTALTAIEHRFLERMMCTYSRNGLSLGSADRARLMEIDRELFKRETAFSRNISECDERVVLNEAEMAGLDPEQRGRFRKADGTYEIVVQNPDYEHLLKYLDSEAVRKRLFYAFHNRVKEENLPLLCKILKLRAQRAKLLGYDSFAEFTLADTMAKKPENVWRFLDRLSEKILPKALSDYRALCRQAGLEVMDSWDKFYYTKLYKQDRYRVADEDTRSYFSLDRVLDGAFFLLKTLFRIEISRTRTIAAWHAGVRVYQVRERGKLIARFYLDPYRRANKYNQAACFGIQNGRRLADGYQVPEAALVFNFSPPSGRKPCLLSHQEITGLFHEIGHLLHHLLTRSPFAMLSGTYVSEDFVEMPSKLMEHWSWEKDILRACSSHYKTGEAIPDELVEGLAAARDLNTGINTQLQVQFAAMDLSYHQIAGSATPAKTTALAVSLQKKYNLYRPAPGTCPQASFDHLVGYASTYYGYLWSRTYAEEMFAVFKKHGILNPAVGSRFRDLVLAVGNTVEPMAIIEEFLGRAPRAR